ncbi:kinase-like protein, partial [Rickenella mellea]
GVASGLAYLHQADVVHGDMKSDNILISSRGTPLLVDFGISRTLVVTQVVSGLQALMGSVRWMAEELVNPNGYLGNEQTDIWAFGMVIYELLTCAHPFNGLSEIQAWLTIAKGERPQAPIDMDQKALRQSLWTLCNVCWGDPDDQLPMKDVVLGLNNQILVRPIVQSLVLSIKGSSDPSRNMY